MRLSMTKRNGKGRNLMIRSSTPLAINKLKKWWDSEEKILKCDLPFQRHSGAWNPITKSSLIRSLLADSYVPPVVFLKDRTGTDEKGKDTYTYNILDGQQRLTNIFSFLNDEWALHAETLEIEYDNFTYEIAGRKFSELEEELRNHILQFKLTVQFLENYTMQEAEELFFNINSGVALSAVQKSKAKMGTDMIKYLSELLRGTFFSQAVHVTEAQSKREEDLLMLIQSVILLDNRFDGIEYKSIAAAFCQKYAADLRNNYGDEHRKILSDTIAYLDNAFSSKNKFLRKNNVPIVVVIGRVALEQKLKEEDFKLFINEFSNQVYPSYDNASGSGNIKAKQVQMRLRVMFLAFCKHFSLDADKIGRPFANGIDLYEGITEEDGLLPESLTVEETAKEQVSDGGTSEEEEENAEVSEEPVSLDGVPEDGAKIAVDEGKVNG